METPGGRILRQRPVRPMSVVMIGVLTKDQPQVPFVGDQHLVQAVSAGAAHPALRDRVRPRRPDGRLDDPHARVALTVRGSLKAWTLRFG